MFHKEHLIQVLTLTRAYTMKNKDVS